MKTESFSPDRGHSHSLTVPPNWSCLQAPSFKYRWNQSNRPPFVQIALSSLPQAHLCSCSQDLRLLSTVPKLPPPKLKECAHPVSHHPHPRANPTGNLFCRARISFRVRCIRVVRPEQNTANQLLEGWKVYAGTGRVWKLLKGAVKLCKRVVGE